MTENISANLPSVPDVLPASLEKKLLKITRYLTAERQGPGSGDALLFEILHIDFFRVRPLEIAKLSVELNRRQRRGELISFRSLVQEKINTAQTTLFDPPVTQELAKAVTSLNKLIAAVPDILTNSLYEILLSDYNGLDSLAPIAEVIDDKTISAIKPRLAKLDDTFIQTLLHPFILHATALNNYLNCPLKFYHETLIRAPYARSDAAEFGCAVHTALQAYFEKMQRDPEQQFPSPDALLHEFDSYMHRRKNVFFLFDFDQRLTHGREILSRYYEKNILNWNKIVAIERNISNVVVSGVPVKGFLDKLEFNGRDVTIVDYKTGNLQRAFGQVKPPHDVLPNGGNYWRQAVFYKILVDNYPGKSWNVVGVSFDFVEPDEHNELHSIAVPIGPADIETVTQQIVAVWKNIQASDFYTGCGKAGCYWCDFAREL